jgi:hypothetical protein
MSSRLVQPTAATSLAAFLAFAPLGEAAVFTFKRRIAVAIGTAVTALALAATAQASSIVFVRGGDVFLTTPDGSRELRVTTGGDFVGATQSDDGRIFAVSPTSLSSFAPNGRRLAGPTPVGSKFDIDVTPDGSKLAYWTGSSSGAEFSVMNSDGSPASGWDDQSGWFGTWINNDLALYSNAGGYIDTLFEGTGNWSDWFAEPDGRKHASAITRATDELVVVSRDWDNVGAEFGPYKTIWYSNSATPPTDGRFGGTRPASERPTVRCTVENPSEPQHPSFAPDGSAIAWEFEDGVHVLPAVNLSDCSQPSGGFTIAGARSPDWGPADVPAAAAACVVPKLKDKSLGKAKKVLKAAHCKLGKVSRKRSGKKPGTVLKQSPKPGKRLASGAKVRVVVAKRR